MAKVVSLNAYRRRKAAEKVKLHACFQTSPPEQAEVTIEELKKIGKIVGWEFVPNEDE